MEKKRHMPILLELYLLFAEIGGTTFGGGYAMLPILQRELVEKRHWTTEEDLMDYYAIGQCTPGIIAVNTATFIGNSKAGPLGGLVATLGVVSPSVLIITLISIFLTNFADLAVVKYAFDGIRAAVCVLILDAVIKLGKKSIKDIWCWLIFLVVLLVSLLADISPIWLVIFSGVAGCLLKPISDKEVAKKAAKTGRRADRAAGSASAGGAADGASAESGQVGSASAVKDSAGEKGDKA